MSKGNVFENDLLNLILRAVAIANIADNAATGPLTNLFVAFHTADPGDAGSQTTSECTYTGYARIAVPRTTGGWSAPTTGSSSPAAAITGGACTAGINTITHWSLGTLVSGVGKILYKGTVTPNIAVTNGVTPSLSTATSITED